ncbi:permease [Absiella sp. AM29-15]|uniref:permease n=1 Tax=Absiella sp. AM29-15 TaxID=2292278 RepID=UPI000E423511|nr:permease [Absiella sp. AM29-15]RGC46357.1 permease [Absiella sp. AM29-15]
MNTIFVILMYVISAMLLVISFQKDRKKTKQAIHKAWKMFMKVLPQFISIILVVGLLLAMITTETIRSIIGSESGFMGMLMAALLGAITLVPVLVAFPITAQLLQNGAGIMQIAVFISTLTMVGIVSLPMEIKYLGRKTAILRNTLSFLFAFLTAWIMGLCLS